MKLDLTQILEVLQGVVILLMLDEEQKLGSYPLYIFLQPPVVDLSSVQIFSTPCLASAVRI
jgi:hypothetical protein